MNNGHRCLVFEQLHYNLFDILRFNNFTGMNIRHVQRIAYQVRFSSPIVIASYSMHFGIFIMTKIELFIVMLNQKIFYSHSTMDVISN